ncbi:hypothetical protein [Gluconobacter sp. P5H9_d]|uniref:hypothetical protein n=3 Tax=Gluconobacter TaxID=441 RepID=UPI00207B5EBD|nr:hypothetical protein [Gluconobacter sp. P5H9_d]
MPKPSVPATVPRNMAAFVRHFRSPRGIMAPRALSLAGCILLATPLLAGCKLVDQRTFNPQAGKPPQPYIPPPPPAPKAKPPFLQIEGGTPESEYGPVVDQAVKSALARKENVLFIVRLLVPLQSDPAAQAKAMTEATQTDLEPVAHRISTAGAQPIQIEMHALTDPSVQHPLIRVDVR